MNNTNKTIEEKIEEKILDLYKTSSFQKLNAYYGRSTVYSVLGIERSETRHSAFIAWLLQPDSFHGLKEEPLRRFLALIASKGYKRLNDQIREHLVAGNYSLNAETIKTEQAIASLARDNDKELDESYKNDAKNRFDIWMLIKIKYFDANDNEQEWCLPVVVENKIYSCEGNYNKENAQTVRYCNAIEKLFANQKTQPLLVFLNTSDGNEPTSKSFVRITYQDLLDHVILPCSFLATSQGSSIEAKVLIDGYVRNLSCPSNKDGEKTKDYSILAIAETESNDLNKIFESDAFKAALYTTHNKEAKMIMAQEKCKSDNGIEQFVSDTERQEDISISQFDTLSCQQLLEHFWNNNEDIFKIVLFNRVKGDPEDSPRRKAVNDIIKVGNRDNTRYFVETNGERKNQKPVPKSEASFLIFKAFCEMHGNKSTIKQLQRAFPGKLNSYYAGRFLNQLFHNVTDEGVMMDCGKYKGQFITKDNPWDFYWDEGHRLPIDGNVRSVKMWRKVDFDNLIEKAKEYGIIVKPAQ